MTQQKKEQGKEIVKQSDIINSVANKIRGFQNSGELNLPVDYSPENAIKAAWLTLQEVKDKDGKQALEVCTQASVATAMLDMIVQGLNPIKKQVYFIVYGKQLVAQRSYFGSIALAKRLAGAKDVWAEVVYHGDEFEYEINRGRKRVIKHTQKLENVTPENITGAYCIIEFKDGTEYTEIMTMDQIRKSWKKSKMNPNGDNSTHKQFPDQMATRTVINRACKKFINSSSDSYLFQEAANRAAEISTEQEVEDEIKENANQEMIDVETGPGPGPENGQENDPPISKEEAAEIEAAEAAEAEQQATGTNGPGF